MNYAESLYSVVAFVGNLETRIGSTQRASSGPTHTRTEGRAPVLGSEFTTKAATQQVDSAEFVTSLCVVGLNPFVARAQFFLTRFPARKKSPSGDLKLHRRSRRDRGRRAPRGARTCRPRPRGKQVDAFELRVVVE